MYPRIHGHLKPELMPPTLKEERLVVGLHEAQAASNHCVTGYGNENVSQIAVPFGRAGLGADSGPVPYIGRDRLLDLCEVIATR